MPNRALPNDTTLDAARAQIAVWQRLGSDRSVLAALNLSEAARRDFEASLRQRHPEYTEQRARLEALRLLMGEESFRRAYPGLLLD